MWILEYKSFNNCTFLKKYYILNVKWCPRYQCITKINFIFINFLFISIFLHEIKYKEINIIVACYVSNSSLHNDFNMETIDKKTLFKFLSQTPFSLKSTNFQYFCFQSSRQSGPSIKPKIVSRYFFCVLICYEFVNVYFIKLSMHKVQYSIACSFS